MKMMWTLILMVKRICGVLYRRQKHMVIDINDLNQNSSVMGDNMITLA